MFGPELIRINESIAIKKSHDAVSKLLSPEFFLLTPEFCFAASAAKFWKHDISSASERAFSVLWRYFWLRNSLQKEVLQYTRIHSLLVNGVVTASNHALWRVLWNIVIWLLGHFWVDTPHINTFERDSVLSKLVVGFPPPRSRRLRLGLCQRKRFSQKWFRLRFAECMSTRQSR